ncbi:hypothetical protein IPG41_01850 [Candidatus Peregrinibacteria bacterium]|nr:MAG: hypothetical protein IPG41_01850 [Candidatus Peregrinibacteria bacterium]
MKKIIFTLAAAFLIFSGCGYIEDSYQEGADAARLSHYDYYMNLLQEYKEKTGTYPLMELYVDQDVYIIVIEGGMPDWVDDGGHPVDYYEDDLFFTALEEGLGREVEEFYDPQNYAESSRPIFYVYSLSAAGAGFTVHLYYEAPGSFKVMDHYYKLEEFLPFE